ncbi:MAG: DUF1919 domain-containing protein [Clostridia bacterium]|nr:DUF1919 domain-containing protein [Clostridia bacterium]
MTSYKQRIYCKINAILDKYLVGLRRRSISNTDFSIICNNCWAGYVYRRFGLSYLSPTVGLYFFPEDFLKLCSDVKGYMEKPLEFISYSESKYKEIIEQRKQTQVPIGRLGDIEIIFLHYPTREEAAEKWQRRANRINYDNLIFKFSKMNFCTDEHLKQFDELDVRKKICFVPYECKSGIKCGIRFKSSPGSENIANDSIEYSRYVNLRKMINSDRVCGNQMEGTWDKK